MTEKELIKKCLLDEKERKEVGAHHSNPDSILKAKLEAQIAKAIPIIRNKEQEERLAKMLEKDGKRTPDGDLFRELADPVFRYHYIKACYSTEGKIITSLISRAKKESVEFLGIYENDMGFCEMSNHIPYTELKKWGIK